MQLPWFRLAQWSPEYFYSKFALLLALGSVSFYVWTKYQTAAPIEVPSIGATGFVMLPTPSNGNAKTVMVLAAENCPKEDARRADELANELARRHIPYTRAPRKL